MNIRKTEPIRHLTSNGIYLLLDKERKDIIVQMLEPEAIVNHNRSLKFKIYISDGYAKQKAVLGNEASLTFNAAGQPNFCLIRVKELMQQNAQPTKRLVIITKIEIIDAEINELIGHPIDYSIWFDNNKQNISASNQTSIHNHSKNLISDDQNNLNEEFLPFNQLAPNVPFVIKARVTNKHKLSSITKPNSMEIILVFSLDLIDKEGNEIIATFFGEAAEVSHPILEENAVYIMRDGYVKMATSKFSKKSSNTHQIIFDKAQTLIQKVEGDTDIPINKFTFTKMSTIRELPYGSIIDIAAYIYEVEYPQQVNFWKTYERKNRREIYLYDDSNIIVKMVLWEEATELDLQLGDLVLIKNARICESTSDSPKNLSSSLHTKILNKQDLFPDMLEIRQLIEWKQKDFCSSELKSLGTRKETPFTIEEIHRLSDKIGDATLFDVTAHVEHIKTENLYYAACSLCNRQIADNGSLVKCNDCIKYFAQPYYRYTLDIKLSDHTGGLWVNALDKVSTFILNHDARSIKELKDRGKEHLLSEIFSETRREFRFILLAKLDTRQEPRVKIQAISVSKINNYSKEAKDILKQLKQYSQKGNN